MITIVESLREFGAAMLLGSAALGITRLRQIIKKRG